MDTEKRPDLRTTLYRKPMQPSNFDGILYQLCYWIFLNGLNQKIRFKGNFKKRPTIDFRQKSNFLPCSDALRQDPLEAILVIFGRRALIFFCLKALGKKWKMTPLLCACAVVITLEMQKCRKRAPRSVEFNFFINCDRHKRFSQTERRRADLQNVASVFLIFA